MFSPRLFIYFYILLHYSNGINNSLLHCFISHNIGCSYKFEFGVLRHMQRYFNDIYVTAQMCRRTEEVVPTVGLPTP